MSAVALLHIDGREGNALAPTVVRGARPADEIACEEVFGPVLTVLPFLEAPFGGRGCSGIGREQGMEGLLEFTEIKNVFISGG
jgi:acyl-CoA reductase-like NAD-dependent aldehyde dehydrogenase